MFHFSIPIHQSIYQVVLFALLQILPHGGVVSAMMMGEIAIASARPQDGLTSSLLTDFETPFNHTFGDFAKGAVTVQDGVVHIQADKTRGGAILQLRKDLSPFAEMIPVMFLKRGSRNQDKVIKLLLQGAGNKQVFMYALADVPTEKFKAVLPEYCLQLNSTAPGKPAVDLSEVQQLQIQGSWKSTPMDVYIDRIEFVKSTAAMDKQRIAWLTEKLKQHERKQQQEAAAAKHRAALLAEGLAHPQDGPWVEHICAVDRHVLALQIQAGWIEPAQQQPYRKQPGDKVEGKGQTVLVWQDGRVVRDTKERLLKRDIDGDGKAETFEYIEPYHGDQAYFLREVFRGQPLVKETVDSPEAYRLSSSDDARFSQALNPKAVYRKVKPMDKVEPGGSADKMPLRHTIYLELPYDLQEGSVYTVNLHALNTRQATVEYKHRPQKVRTEALHVSQIGYRPDDPFKRAYLSLWKGTGGEHRYDGIDRFYLIDQGGECVFEGKVVLGFAADQPEKLKANKNFAKTHVYYLDFSAFDKPGTYRVLLPEIGTSYPVKISTAAWADAFRISMHGFLSHRSGIELGPPFSDYRRPRNMHPADGFKVFITERTIWDGMIDAINAGLEDKLQGTVDMSRLQTHAHAWGGYMDAGDFDRRSGHLAASYEHLELVDMFPDVFEQMTLSLPPEEAKNNIPDLLDEALWNIAFYKRLQEPDGGVRGGVESTSHPRAGETSWQDSLVAAAYGVDPETTLRYAACAAKAARLLSSYDKRLARDYRESALSAWLWFQNKGTENIAAHKARGARSLQKGLQRLPHWQALAAVELYRLTKEPLYHQAFKQSAAIAQGGDAGKQLNATFAYALVPDTLTDAVLKAKAQAFIIAQAEKAMAFQQNNAFQIATCEPSLPMIGYVSYWSTPEMTVGAVLPRAHYLSGKQKYLRAAVAAAQYSAGANPMNMTYTTGVGYEWPTGVLQMDSRRSGQDYPRGITVFGQSDPAVQASYLDWAHTWYLNPTMVPSSRSWPAHEAYVGMYKWPAMNEYTIHQSFRPTSYYWGYLAARAAE